MWKAWLASSIEPAKAAGKETVFHKNNSCRGRTVPISTVVFKKFSQGIDCDSGCCILESFAT